MAAARRLIIHSIVTIARGLGKATVAEFVGDEQTLRFLREHGVEERRVEIAWDAIALHTSPGIANRKADEVRAEARANLIPGAILVPSGIYALIRAQNAGCAFMPGS